MSVSYEAFVAEFPEFSEAPRTLVEAKLRGASLQISPEVWGPNADEGIKSLAASLIASSPHGMGSRLTKDDDKTVYEKNFLALQLSVAPRVLVT